MSWLSFTAVKWIVYAIMAATFLGLVTYVKVEWDRGQHAIHVVHAAHVVAKRQTAAVIRVDKPAATAEKAAQTTIVYRTRTLIRKVAAHVTASTPCIPWAVVRLHDAAVLHVDPASLQPPAGQSDDACSDVAPTAFVVTVIDNYAVADANAEQLNALEANIAARAAAAQAVVVPPPQDPVASVNAPF